MLTADARERAWAAIEAPWDLVVVGGGITGAGILHEAARTGLRALLVEQGDFASGTSSRSSKLVHGGVRYLAEGQVALTREAVRERKRLLAEVPGLITPLGFLIPLYRGDGPGRWALEALLAAYDLLAPQWSHRYFDRTAFGFLMPHLTRADLTGGLAYGDAQTDDARLTLRVIAEAVAAGGTALNYVAATGVLRDGDTVAGVYLHDRVRDRTAEVRARAVVNATGAWADHLRGEIGAPPRIRPLRGSLLVFPAWRFPVAQAITFWHPVDRRGVAVIPWEGVTLLGTTDRDYHETLDAEPAISPEEVAYLMAAAEARFPALGLTLDDIIASWSGVRPVIDTGAADPSRESRDFAVWDEQGLLTVTGGKLTTFRPMAHHALDALRRRLPDLPTFDPAAPILAPPPADLGAPLPDDVRLRLAGRYGAAAPALVAAARAGELEPIPGTRALWAELRWAARSEAVVHLDDLLLRRVRLGLLLPGGGADLLPRIRAVCQPELGWDDARWAAEEAAYLALRAQHYSLPDRASIPDWRMGLAEAAAQRAARRAQGRRRRRRWQVAGAGGTILLALGALALRRRRG